MKKSHTDFNIKNYNSLTSNRLNKKQIGLSPQECLEHLIKNRIKEQQDVSDAARISGYADSNVYGYDSMTSDSDETTKKNNFTTQNKKTKPLLSEASINSSLNRLNKINHNGSIKSDSINNLVRTTDSNQLNYFTYDLINKRIQLSKSKLNELNNLVDCANSNTSSANNNTNSKSANLNESKTDCSIINNKLFDKLNSPNSVSFASNNTAKDSIYGNSMIKQNYPANNMVNRQNNNNIKNSVKIADYNNNNNQNMNVSSTSPSSSSTSSTSNNAAETQTSSGIDSPPSLTESSGAKINTNSNNLVNVIYACTNQDTDSGRHSMSDSPCSILPLPPLPPSLSTTYENEINEFISSSGNIHQNNRKSNKVSAAGTFSSKCILSTGNQITFTQKLQQTKIQTGNNDNNNINNTNNRQNSSFNYKSSQNLTSENKNVNIRNSRNAMNLEC